MNGPIKKLQSDVRLLRVRGEIRPAGRYTAFSATNVQNRWTIPEKCTVRPQEAPWPTSSGPGGTQIRPTLPLPAGTKLKNFAIHPLPVPEIKTGVKE